MDINITKSQNSKISEVDYKNLGFCKYYSDHMFICDYNNGSWKNFRIQPFQDLTLSPACTTLHYGQTIFEGLKAYRDSKGKILIFRPEKIMRDLIRVLRECVCLLYLKIFLLIQLRSY